MIVGYNNTGDAKGNPFWIIKNSLGKYWGDNGYMYLYKDMKSG